MGQIEKTTTPTSGSLVSRIAREFEAHGLSPDLDVFRLAEAADGYADMSITGDDLQDSLVRYIDTIALKSQLMSRAIRRWKEPPIADAMTGALNIVVDGIVRSPSLRSEGLRVSSEENFRLSTKGIRKPDVAVWKGDQLLAIVECKTSLGFTRKTWEADYTKRVNEFVGSGLDPRGVIYVVASEDGWSGFDPSDPRTGTVWFALGGKGSWFGGGKFGEVTLKEGMRPGQVRGLASALESLLITR